MVLASAVDPADQDARRLLELAPHEQFGQSARRTGTGLVRQGGEEREHPQLPR